MQDQKQPDEIHALLSRIAIALEIRATIQLLEIRYPNATDRDAQLEAYEAKIEAVERAIEGWKMAGNFTPKALPVAVQAVDDAKAEQLAFEVDNPLIVRLDGWLKRGMA